MSTDAPAETLRLTLDVWHPGCWVLDVTEDVEVGILGFAIYTREDGRATTQYMAYGDDSDLVEDAVGLIREHPSVYGVSEMIQGYRRGTLPVPGNATRDLLVDHDGTTQITDAFKSRGFVEAAPVDAYGDTERWTVLSNADRETIQALLDEIREQENAKITVRSIGRASDAGRVDSLRLDRLSHRQREIFQLARTRGYYHHPKRTSARELATELEITTSTFHEHLHKAESKLLDSS